MSTRKLENITLINGSSANGGVAGIDGNSTNIPNFVGNNVTLVSTGSATDFLNAQGNYVAETGSGDVIGPGSAVDSNVPSFNTTTGKLIKDSGIASSLITTNQTDIGTNTTNIGTNTTNIGTNTTNIGTVTGLVNTVQLQIAGSSSSFLNAQGNYVVETGSGDVIGPGSSVTNNISSFSDGTGKVIKDSGVPVSQIGFNESNIGTNSLTIGVNAKNIFVNRQTVAVSSGSNGMNLTEVNAVVPVTITLFTVDISSDTSITVKDISGNASTNNITIATEGSQLIDGQATHVISSDYGSALLVCNGGSVSVISEIDPGNGNGDVVGPASAIDGNKAVFDGTSGKLLKDGGSNANTFSDKSDISVAKTVLVFTPAGVPLFNLTWSGSQFRVFILDASVTGLTMDMKALVSSGELYEVSTTAKLHVIAINNFFTGFGTYYFNDPPASQNPILKYNVSIPFSGEGNIGVSVGIGVTYKLNFSFMAHSNISTQILTNGTWI